MMRSQGFFSVFVGAFAIALLISLLYSQSVQYDSQSQAESLAIVNEQVSKDWFLARNALENFAADAILFDIRTPSSPSSSNCNAGVISGANFGTEVENYFDQATTFMHVNYGLNCDANLDVRVHNTLENTSLSPPEAVRSDTRAYGLLTCTRSSGDVSLTITHPFVLRKEVAVSGGGVVPCVVNIYDRLGDTGSPAYRVLDVTQSFP